MMGSLPILSNENRASYEQFVVELAREGGPQDTVEWLLLLNLAHVSRKIVRLQRAAANIANKGRRKDWP
jgi:hypothetical protein